ncbi:hypothetical protein [Agrobacterium tumefaciens]|uniref:hypothetical protein n=1 Tax=Agrobacterium tumefaciens TaxID=358 RepID=UPI000EF28DCA|nr:hypothetical protein [Agrobacterium tumefaciens]AYM09428.1 hypothetical protein At1D1460_51870 [Agrobacterium tumefaciens]NSZ35696.1 hypothetical protein [Agrobacterium tumefaciens]QLG25774.1 hypothetical protein EML4_26125 [Agrobacterium tumefaciens]UXS89643.1 hypothetical protein FY144_26085 [Agrobacterium tumefaciens]
MLRWRTCEEIIKRGFAQLMKAEGLAKADRNWRRGHDESRLVLNLEASSPSAGENSKFAINLDVFAAAIVEKGGHRAFNRKASAPSANPEPPTKNRLRSRSLTDRDARSESESNLSGDRDKGV